MWQDIPCRGDGVAQSTLSTAAMRSADWMHLWCCFKSAKVQTWQQTRGNYSALQPAYQLKIRQTDVVRRVHLGEPNQPQIAEDKDPKCTTLL